MGYDKRKYEYFFPQKVYRCVCLGSVITSCLVDGIYSLAVFAIKLVRLIVPNQKKYIVLNAVKINKMLFLAVLIIWQ